jgi:hypothetical protein
MKGKKLPIRGEKSPKRGIFLFQRGSFANLGCSYFIGMRSLQSESGSSLPTSSEVTGAGGFVVMAGVVSVIMGRPVVVGRWVVIGRSVVMGIHSVVISGSFSVVVTGGGIVPGVGGVVPGFSGVVAGSGVLAVVTIGAGVTMGVVTTGEGAAEVATGRSLVVTAGGSGVVEGTLIVEVISGVRVTVVVTDEPSVAEVVVD